MFVPFPSFLPFRFFSPSFLFSYLSSPLLFFFPTFPFSFHSFLFSFPTFLFSFPSFLLSSPSRSFLLSFPSFHFSPFLFSFPSFLFLSPLFLFSCPSFIIFLLFYALCFPFSYFIFLLHYFFTPLIFSSSSYSSPPLISLFCSLFFLLNFSILFPSCCSIPIFYTLLSFSPSFFPPQCPSFYIPLSPPPVYVTNMWVGEHFIPGTFWVTYALSPTLQPHHHRYSCFGVWSGHGSDRAHKCSHCVQLPGSKVIMLIDLLASRLRVFLASLLSHKMAPILLLYGDGWCMHNYMGV